MKYRVHSRVISSFLKNKLCWLAIYVSLNTCFFFPQEEKSLLGGVQAAQHLGLSGSSSPTGSGTWCTVQQPKPERSLEAPGETSWPCCSHCSYEQQAKKIRTVLHSHSGHIVKGKFFGNFVIEVINWTDRWWVGVLLVIFLKLRRESEEGSTLDKKRVRNENV